LHEEKVYRHDDSGNENHSLFDRKDFHKEQKTMDNKKKPERRWRRRMFVFGGLLLIFLAASSIYEAWVSEKEKKANPPPGKIVEVNDKNIHLHQRGEGDPTVVFTAGSGTASPYADMYKLQEAVSKEHSTIMYERPGYGWSEPSSQERTVHNMTSELKQALEKSGEGGPYVFAAHSMGALEVLHYAQRYPEEVKGIVLIDGVHPRHAAERTIETPMRSYVYKAMRNTGILRLLMQSENFASMEVDPYEQIPEDIRKKNELMTLQHRWNDTMIAEREKFNENGRTVYEEGDIGDIPLTILTADFPGRENWHETQLDMKDYSSQSEQEIVPHTTHFLHHEEPEVVIEAILEAAK
jgi:pimeloyl-ACP methyl ester carboxylesterase